MRKRHLLAKEILRFAQRDSAELGVRNSEVIDN